MSWSDGGSLATDGSGWRIEEKEEKNEEGLTQSTQRTQSFEGVVAGDKITRAG